MFLEGKLQNISLQGDQLWHYHNPLEGHHPLVRFYQGPKVYGCDNREAHFEKEIKKVKNIISNTKISLDTLEETHQVRLEVLVTTTEKLKKAKKKGNNLEKIERLQEEQEHLQRTTKNFPLIYEKEYLNLKYYQSQLKDLQARRDSLYIRFEKTDIPKMVTTLDQTIAECTSKINLLQYQQYKRLNPTCFLKCRGIKPDPLIERKIEKLTEEKEALEGIKSRIELIWKRQNHFKGSIKLEVSTEYRSILLKHLVVPKKLQDIDFTCDYEYLFRSSIDNILEQSPDDPETLRQAGINYILYGTANYQLDSIGKRANQYTQYGINLLKRYAQLHPSSN